MLLGITCVLLTLGTYPGIVSRMRAPTGYHATDIPGLYVYQKDVALGEIEPDRIAKSEFKLLNTGNSSLKIHKATSSCGCSGAIFMQDSIAPGQDAVVSVRFDPSQITDSKFRKMVRLDIREGHATATKPLLLAFSGTLNRSRELRIWPKVLDFGEMAPGQAASRRIYLYGNKGLLEGLADTVSLRTQESVVFLPQTAFRDRLLDIRSVEVELAVPQSQGRGELAFTLSFERTDGTRLPTIVTAYVNCRPDLLAEPEAPLLGRNTPSQPVPRGFEPVGSDNGQDQH
jgi:hypothetical protein